MCHIAVFDEGKTLSVKKMNDLPIKVGFFPFNIDSIEWIKPKPSSERESILIRPLGQRWKNDSL